MVDVYSSIAMVSFLLLLDRLLVDGYSSIGSAMRIVWFFKSHDIHVHDDV